MCYLIVHIANYYDIIDKWNRIRKYVNNAAKIYSFIRIILNINYIQKIYELVAIYCFEALSSKFVTCRSDILSYQK